MIPIDGIDLLNVVQRQRNDALDEAANKSAAIEGLLRRIAELEKQIADGKQAQG